ncbi:MAG: hypothetical protein MHM6MM_004710 [Cercozoa sp. M6MM]
MSRLFRKKTAEKLVHIHLIEACDLPAGDLGGSCDPFMKISLRKRGRVRSSVKSRVARDTREPVWNEVFSLPLTGKILSHPSEHSLTLQLRDWDRFSRNDALAEVIIPLKQIVSTVERSNESLDDRRFSLSSTMSTFSAQSTAATTGSRDEPSLQWAATLGVTQATLSKKDTRVFTGWWPLTLLNKKNARKGKVLLSIAIDDAPALDPSDTSVSAINKSASNRRRRRELFGGNLVEDDEETEAKVMMITWNCGNAAPPASLADLIPNSQSQDFDLYVVGLQEAKYDVQGFPNCQTHLLHLLKQHFGENYGIVADAHMWEIRLFVVAPIAVRDCITAISVSKEATGIGGIMGNKGGVAISLTLSGTRLCFVNSHLAAHQDKTEKRNADVREIVNGVRVGLEGQDILNQFHSVFWMGDLNYRLDYGDQGNKRTPSAELFSRMTSTIGQGKLKSLFRHDQLSAERAAGRVFDESSGWREGDYAEFGVVPTFKVLRDEYLQYTSKRSPAWCDRVLWRCAPGFEDDVQLRSLTAVCDVTTSDHKPLRAEFGVRVVSQAASVQLTPIVARTDDEDDSDDTLILRIKDLSCDELPPADVSGTSDPYVRFLAQPMLEAAVDTKVVNSTLAPRWTDDQVPPLVLRWNNLKVLRRALLSFVIRDRDRTRDDTIARGLICLREATDAFERRLQNEEEESGEAEYDVVLTSQGLPAGRLRCRLRLELAGGGALTRSHHRFLDRLSLQKHQKRVAVSRD